jgi:hypothetical protein
MSSVLSVLKHAVFGGKTMNWFKIEVKDARKGEGYQYVGASEDSPKELARKATNGEYIQLDDLRYMDRGTLKKWEQWDASLIPTVYINPALIVTIMQFKDDPAVTPR